VQHLISALASNGGKARIPALKFKAGKITKTATSNVEKGTALAKGFFPQKLQSQDPQEGAVYPKACSKAGKVTEEQIQKQLKKLKPYKAPGPDGIPNIVLTKNADLLVKRLLPIYTAILDKNLQYSPWKTFTTVILYKPGKLHYDVPKAYCPIALLNTMWKVLSTIVANLLRPIGPLRCDVCKGKMCGSDKEVIRVVIPLITEVVLECNKGEKVAKTNVWVEIKRKGKYLQGVEDNFKERNKGNGCSSNKD